ncbi:tyrosine-type recombinase/integrase [Trueperella sp. LYQ141]|uniref:tyrosine-type recombinase/integrase n=1 Tax=Trueperella sp. LYQ141 TaxID=3391058 RepID=UPI003983D743
MAVQKLPSGRWRGIVKQGRVAVATKTFDLKRDACAWVEAERAKMSQGYDPKLGKQVLRRVINDYLAWRKQAVRSTTYKTDQHMLALIAPNIANRTIGSITAREIEHCYTRLVNKGYKHATIKRFRDSLRAFFTWAQRQNIVTVNPVSVASLPRRQEPEHQMHPWTFSELIHDYHRWQTLNPSSALVALFLGLTGLRWSEARALTVSDVTLDTDPSVFVQKAQPEGVKDPKTTKSGRTRRVPLAEAIVPFIQQQVSGKQSTDKLLPPMHQSRFRRQLHWNTTAGGRTIHDLRHTAICLWLSAGIDLATVRAWAGHADLATTSRYTHWLGTEADRASINKLNHALRRGTQGVHEKEKA